MTPQSGGALPNGLTFNADNRTLSADTTVTAGTTTVTYLATDTDDSSATATVDFDITVVDTTPTPDNTAPVIALNGEGVITLAFGDTYDEPGARVSDDDPLYSGTVTVGGGTVDTSTAATYTITYTAPADAAGNTPTSLTRTVTVEEEVDTTSPVITAPDDIERTSISDNLLSINIGTATATDDIDADPTITNDAAETFTLGSTGRFSFPIGTHTITWTATDSSGNSIDADQTITILDGSLGADTTAPVIALSGTSPVNLEVSGRSIYTDAGATAANNVDGVITANIVTVNPVDNGVIGIYTVTYDVTDEAGNVADQVTRTVNVRDSSKPVIALTGLASITLTVGGTYTEQDATVTDNDPAYSATVTTGGDIVDTSTAGTYIVTYTAPDDAAGNTPTAVTRTVVVEAVPAFDFVEVDDQEYTVDTAIDGLTLPEASGGTGDLPDGLDFNADTRTLSGTPAATTDSSGVALTYTAKDANGAIAELEFFVIVNPVPLVFARTIADQEYTAGMDVGEVELPLAVNDNSDIGYTLTAPGGVALSAAIPGLDYIGGDDFFAPTITGTPRDHRFNRRNPDLHGHRHHQHGGTGDADLHHHRG